MSIQELIKDHTAAMPGHIAWLTSLGLVFDAVYGHCHVPYLDKAGVFADRIHVYKGGGAIGGGGPMMPPCRRRPRPRGPRSSCPPVHQPGHRRRRRRHRRQGHGPERRPQHPARSKGVVVATSSIDHNAEMAKALNAQQYWDITSQTVYTVPTDHR